jgi:hypothetical protein
MANNQDTWNNGKYTIRNTGQEMKEFPGAFKYGNYCSPNADASEVLGRNGNRMFVGTYEACRNFISVWESSN